MRNVTVLEGQSFTADFFGGGDVDIVFGLRYFTSNGTAIAGQDFIGKSYSGSIPPHGNGQYVFSINVQTIADDRFEGDETFEVSQYVTYEGERSGFHDYLVTIVDTTGKTVYADLNRDGFAEAIEITAYNHAQVWRSATIELLQNSVQRDQIEARIALLERQIIDSEFDLAFDTALALNADNAVLRGALKDFLPNKGKSFFEAADDIYEGAKTGASVLSDDSALAKTNAILSTLGNFVEKVPGPAARAMKGIEAFGTASELGINAARIDVLRDELAQYYDAQLDLVLQAQALETIEDAAAVVGRSIESRVATSQLGEADRLSFKETVGDFDLFRFDGVADGTAVSVRSHDIVLGTANDLIFEIGVSDSGVVIDGGEGFDIAVFDVEKDEATSIIAGSDIAINTETTGNYFSNVERFIFQDGVLALDADDVAGQTYRLYQAAFDRTPDEEGLGFWIGNFDAETVDLREMAGYFIQSLEFSQLYGTPDSLTDQMFLTLLYQNVLDRTPDQLGFDFWQAQQAAGIERVDMLVYFSESLENIENTADQIADGIWYV